MIWTQLSIGGLIGTTCFLAGVQATRIVYKAGQVDALNAQIETLKEADKAKDDLIQTQNGIVKLTQDQMSEISRTLVDLSLRQPKHTEKITERLSDAPTQYAEFDPNKCLSFVYPDGMFNDAREAVLSHIASLPKFDNSGRRVTPLTGQ